MDLSTSTGPPLVGSWPPVRVNDYSAVAVQLLVPSPHHTRQAEGIGILSVLRCSLHLQQLYNISISGTLLCDNKSMIERTQSHADLKTSNPNSTFESDWDVIAEIWSTIQAGSLADTLSFVHIKGMLTKTRRMTN